MNEQDTDRKLDQLIDKISSRYRDEPVPPLPAQLLYSQFVDAQLVEPAVVEPDKPVVKGRTIGWIEIAVMVATVALFITWLGMSLIKELNKPHAMNPSVPTQNARVTEQRAVVERSMAELEPFAELEREIQAMEKEVALLKHEATLLDAFRKANSLIVKN